MAAEPAAAALRASLAATLGPERTGALLDVTVREEPGLGFVVLPADWEQLRHEEGGAGRPVPYWARLWPSGLVLARELAERPPAPGAQVLELGCGLALPSVVAARAGAQVLATDGHPDAVVFAAHTLALNEAGEHAVAAQAEWASQGDALAGRGPWDLVVAADVLYTRQNAEDAARVWPRLLAPGGTLLLADPGRAGARDALAALRASFTLETQERGDDVRLHRLTRR